MREPLAPFHYGVCYYPEAWDPSRHASDIERIADCGFNFVRMGEGAWSYWEPEEGRFQFELFDRVIDLCRKRGVKVILGTPTYACPAWVSTNYPEVLRWNFERVPMKHGSRRNLNYTSPKMLEMSDRLCTALAEHYKNEPQVIGWQLDNEFNCHMDVSYAPADSVAFRSWCEAKYTTLDELNRCWGTQFWSQTYSAWDQIDLPHPTATYLNPSMLLDESRFVSDTVVQFARRQADILRSHSSQWFITHNGLFSNVDGPKLCSVLDFFCQDHYPLFVKDWTQFAEPLLLARSLSFPFGIMEQQSGPGGQMAYLHRTPRPGEMRLWTWGSVAHGANLFSYFRWRTCPYGSEQHWHGLLDPDDKDNRRIAEAKLFGKEIAQLPQAFFETPPMKGVAVLREFDNEVNDRRINTYIGSGRGEYKRWAAELVRQHVPLDFVWSNSDWTGYRLLIAPHLKVVDEALVAKMTAFVRLGGMLLLGAQSGLKDRNLHLVEATPPGLLAELAGVLVEDWSTLPDDQTRQATLGETDTLQLSNFIERLKPTKAQAVAHWNEKDALLLDFPAMTFNRVGTGGVYYVGGYLPEAGMATLVAWLMRTLALPCPIDVSSQVEVVIRDGNSGQFICLMNHSETDQDVRGIPAGTNLLTNQPISGQHIKLPPFGVAIVAT